MERSQDPEWEDTNLVTVGGGSVGLTQPISFFS